MANRHKVARIQRNVAANTLTFRNRGLRFSTHLEAPGVDTLPAWQEVAHPCRFPFAAHSSRDCESPLVGASSDLPSRGFVSGRTAHLGGNLRFRGPAFREIPPESVPSMRPGNLLLVDDDKFILESMADYLRGLGHRTETARCCQEALDRMAEYPFDIVLCDVNLPDADGFQLLETARQRHPDTEVVLVTGFGTIDSAVMAIREGAFDYLTKPIIEDELLLVIERALGKRELLHENKQLKAQLDQRFGLGNIVGRDYKMLKMFDLIESVADTRTTVLVLGESGTGKTMTARAIHQLSTRRNKPFVEVACGSLPDTLLESELFGHVAGAFTGAVHEKVGKFLQADGGTLFLDEIGTASPSLQVKLLRVLQDREFEPVGATKPTRSTCAWCWRPTTISKRWSRKERSVKTCTTASTSSR